jgi:hypothetical protein
MSDFFASDRFSDDGVFELHNYAPPYWLKLGRSFWRGEDRDQRRKCGEGANGRDATTPRLRAGALKKQP